MVSQGGGFERTPDSRGVCPQETPAGRGAEVVEPFSMPPSGASAGRGVGVTTKAGMNRDRDELLAEIDAEMVETAASTGRRALSPRVRAALVKVPRERFVTADEAPYAYLNTPLPIGHGQTISQPFVVALMTELLDLAPDSRVLEIGTGSGYQTAVLAEVASHVFSLEVVPELAEQAKGRLAALGYANVTVRQGDGNLGWPEEAPFDAIIVTAGAPDVPPALVDQLKPGGRLVIPVGRWPRSQTLTLVVKDAAGRVRSEGVLPVAFVPLVKEIYRRPRPGQS